MICKKCNFETKAKNVKFCPSCGSLADGTNEVLKGAEEDFERGLELYENGDYASAFELLVKAAGAKHAGARYYVGMCYGKGQGTEASLAASGYMLKRAALQGITKARKELGKIYLEGYGFLGAIKRLVAYVCLFSAAKSGDAEAQRLFGRLNIGLFADKTALKWLGKAAEAGDVESAVLSADILYGRGKYEQAAELYKKAAEEGNSDALYGLGNCCFNGYGAEKDIGKAIEFFEKSGKTEGKYIVACCLSEGNGAEKNMEKAVALLREVAEAGVPEAQTLLGCYLLENDSEKASGFQWIEKGATSGINEAKFRLGYCYAEGVGTEKDLKKAIEWLERLLCSEEKPDAYVLLGKCYEGSGDFRSAASCYKAAARRGSAEGAENIARCYEKGIGVNANLFLMSKWQSKK